MPLKYISTIFLMLGLVGCDSPRQTRTGIGGTSSNSLTNTAGSTNNFTNQTGTTTTNTTNTDTTNNTNSSIPSNIAHCQWSMDGVNGFMDYNKHLSPNENDTNSGGFTVCQSSTSETDIYLQLKNPINDSQVCLFPTHNEGSNSIYIGEPRCLRVYESKKIYKVSMLKNRPGGYSQFSITGVMIMKDKAYFYPPPFYQYVLSPDAYIFCSQFLDQYADASYCEAFKSVNQYVYKKF